MQTKVKLTKRVVSLATALVTGLSAVGVTGIPGGVFGTLSASAEDGHNYVNGFCTDEGCASPYEPATEENGTYQIANAGNLYWFAEQVNDGNANLNAALTTDIVVNEGNVAGCNGTKDESWRDWEPIGNDSSEYSGTFDGKGHTISGLYFFSDSYEANIVGVVGYLKTGTIQNIGLENSYFYSSNGSYIAGICGYNEGGTIDNCYNAGNINGQQGVGGICGRNNGVFKFASFSFIAGVIKNCYNTGNISGSHSKIGGVCGLNNFTLENCYNTGNVTGGTSASFVGGIVGNNYIDNRNSGYTFRNCYNTGTVTGKSSFGAVYGSDTYKDAQNCYYLSETEVPESDGISGKTADQFASGEVTYLLNGSKPGDTNIFRQNLDNGEPTDATPVLDSAHDVVYEGKLCTSGTGYTNDEDSTSEIHAWDEDGFCKNDDTHYQPAVKNAENVYEISNAGQLYWFASEVNGGNCVNAILTKDIVVNKGDVAGCEGTKTKGWREWTPISYYFDQKMGDFDGKGHTISGLYCNL